MIAPLKRIPVVPLTLTAEESPFLAWRTNALTNRASAWASTIGVSTRSILVRRLHCHNDVPEFAVNAALSDIQPQHVSNL